MSGDVAVVVGGFKPKKSVALSGVAAGNTALCTVGRNGNDLHYRGYDILELAAKCEFEEVAYLLLYGKLPNVAELGAYKARLKGMRGLPDAVKVALEQLPKRMMSRLVGIFCICCMERRRVRSGCRRCRCR